MKTLLDRGRDGECLAGLDITDLHGHLGRYAFGIPDLSVARVVAGMDRLGVARTLMSHMRCMSPDTAWGNEEILAAMRAFPGRILGYASAWPVSAGAVRDEIARRLDQGFTGVKLHNTAGFPYTDPAYAPAFELANARRMPVLLHTWGGPAEFAQIRELSTTWPDTSLLLAHAGSADEAGYIAVARDCPNVYLDTTFSASPRGLVRRLVDGAGADRVVWGTDVLFLNQAQQIGKILGADLPEETKRAILSNNARRILERIRP